MLSCISPCVYQVNIAATVVVKIVKHLWTSLTYCPAVMATWDTCSNVNVKQILLFHCNSVDCELPKSRVSRNNGKTMNKATSQ